ncbi:MAG: carboxypeptidase regulatory-like domain-containing protein, partial [Acidobacteria bacterium]|nr:carboxypeptidase regulatory-like domain-containing protein [Acidobacteriota bacterium]
MSGRVVYEETGEPVRGARVRISARDGSGPAGATVANDRGEFRFDNLAAGDYDVIATPRDAAMVGAATFGVPLPTGNPQADDAAFEAARKENNNGSSAATVSVDGTSDATVEVLLASQQQKGGRIS